MLTSPVVLAFVAYLLWLGITQHWSITPAEGRNHILVLWITFLAVMSLSDEHPQRDGAGLHRLPCRGHPGELGRVRPRGRAGSREPR